jgi:membrane protease subunit HflK
MEEVLRGVNKVLVDKNTSGTGGVLPYLALPAPTQPASQPAPPRAAPPAQGATR